MQEYNTFLFLIFSLLIQKLVIAEKTIFDLFFFAKTYQNERGFWKISILYLLQEPIGSFPPDNVTIFYLK